MRGSVPGFAGHMSKCAWTPHCLWCIHRCVSGWIKHCIHSVESKKKEVFVDLCRLVEFSNVLWVVNRIKNVLYKYSPFRHVDFPPVKLLNWTGVAQEMIIRSGSFFLSVSGKVVWFDSLPQSRHIGDVLEKDTGHHTASYAFTCLSLCMTDK